MLGIDPRLAVCKSQHPSHCAITLVPQISLLTLECVTCLWGPLLTLLGHWLHLCPHVLTRSLLGLPHGHLSLFLAIPAACNTFSASHLLCPEGSWVLSPLKYKHVRTDTESGWPPPFSPASGLLQQWQKLDVGCREAGNFGIACSSAH